MFFFVFSSNRPLKFWGCFRKVNKHQLETCVGRHLRVPQTTVKCSCILQTDSYQLLHANKATTGPSLSLQYYFWHFEERALDKRENTFLQKNKMFLIIEGIPMKIYFLRKQLPLQLSLVCLFSHFHIMLFIPKWMVIKQMAAQRILSKLCDSRVLQ